MTTVNRRRRLASSASAAASANANASAACSSALRGLAAVALTLVVSPSVASAYDPDCVSSNGNGNGEVDEEEAYTGYSLKVGTGCSQYVYCRSGIISSWHTCPGGLMFNGDVGMDGICDWANVVQCRDDGLEMEMGQLEVEGVEALTPKPTPRPTPKPTPRPQQQQQGMAQLNMAGSNPNQQQLAQLTMGTMGSSANPQNYFCGKSMADAAELCIPCPSGKMIECAGDFTHGCFRGIQGCGGGGGGGGGNNADNDSGDMSDAQGLVNSIGDGLDGKNMESIINDYLATTNNFQSNNNSNNNGQSPDQSAQFTQQQTPVPTWSPTLPPWTNAPFGPSPTNTDKTVIGYYASWQWYDRDKLADPNNVDFSKYDRINYAFFQPDPDGYLFGTDEWADPQLLWGPYTWSADGSDGSEYRCSWDGPNYKKCDYHDTSRGMLRRAREAGTEVMPSIGGWTLSDNFPGIAASPSRRNTFAQQCVELIEEYGFDGIDIDWEYPGYEDHSGTPADTVNFTLLLQRVRQKLDALGARTGKFYGLTAALPCGPDKIEKIQVGQIKDILTELNLMSYDLHGAWDALTGTNAPMFDQGWGDSTKRWSVHGCVNNYVELGVPLSRLNVGLPFYGRSVRGATGMKQFHGGADDANFHLDEGSPQYFNIVDKLGEMTTYRHEGTQTQYAAFDESAGGGLVSYDDARAICDKVHYANQRGMHGFLIWEISGDMIDVGGGQIITPLIDATNAKIANPSYDCSTLRDPLWALRDTTYRYAPPEPAEVDWTQYDGPASTGSDNDFSGAQESRPASDGDSSNNPNNSVWVPEPGVDTAPTWASLGDANDDCPPEYDGYFPTPGCGGYVYCQKGGVVGASQPCVPGTKFDLTITACAYEASVQCGR